MDAKARKGMVDEARAAGKAAREAGQPREVPEKFLKDYPVRGQGKAWLEGWDSVKFQQIRTQEVQVIERTAYKRVTDAQSWPQDKDLPETYPRRLSIPPQPCNFKDCRALVLEGGAQAVVTEVTAHGFAYLLCRKCNRRFKRRIV